jgi:hypothetical protein
VTTPNVNDNNGWLNAPTSSKPWKEVELFLQNGWTNPLVRETLDVTQFAL